MINKLIASIDRLSAVLAYATMPLLGILVAVTTYEVVARYVFNAPTVWGVDISNMVKGALFLLALAYTLRCNRHVRIDVLSHRMPPRVRRVVESLFYLLVFLPVVGLLVWAASTKAWDAFMRDEKLFSTWQPIVWPFYFTVVIGLASLWLQAFAEMLRPLARRDAPASASDGSEAEG
jgi:TRAP-type mannitol/chloroaromatic compound transport system permease small subunit